MALYILNSTVIGFGSFRHTPITAEQAKSFYSAHKSIGTEIISAIGHDSTAQVISQILGDNIPKNRIMVNFEKYGDEAIIIRIKTRLQEGEVINSLDNIDYELSFLSCIG